MVNKTTTTEAVVVSSYSVEINSTETTTLNIYLDGPPNFEERHFNWADVTMEIYNTPNCSYLARGAFSFLNLTLWDSNYNLVSPSSVNWNTTPARPCGGTTLVKNSQNIQIIHNP